MRKMIIVLLFFFGVQELCAQEWLTDFEEAKQIAVKNNRPILLVFTGSDWCAPCIKLEKLILHTEEFEEFAKDNYVLLKADFPKRKKNQLSQALQDQNNKLAETYNKRGGFPLAVVLDKTGKKLGAVGYKKVSPGSYIEILKKITR
ncbi:thioredoxin family protein [Aquimarina sp. AU474]|uniref:thioredoxin family protein n=1 Tax=Aquimarina sp. AU474 TaxID=2108529 RepID=UPI000D68F101|nr:thioredoxin family protein [Aquimarina sp. AU474]